MILVVNKDYKYLAQAEILVIDEASAIPLSYIKMLFGPYLIFLSSTTNGYEGTGRSLSLKLLKEVKKMCSDKCNPQIKSNSRSNGIRVFRELTLNEPIRYSINDPIEYWLMKLLCLDCVGSIHQITKGFPPPEDCQLYYVNRDTLFSYNYISEQFLQRIMSLFVSSHYKNSPNDLQLISDAPAHRLYVLLGPRQNNTQLPDILCAIQVCEEGNISKKSVENCIINYHEKKPSGNLIPWTISHQFQDYEFSNLSGIRIVRIATHPDLQRMRYGTRAVQLLFEYYKNNIEFFEKTTEKKKKSRYN
jgi:N-acetyltransferase 10